MIAKFHPYHLEYVEEDISEEITKHIANHEDSIKQIAVICTVFVYWILCNDYTLHSPRNLCISSLTLATMTLSTPKHTEKNIPVTTLMVIAKDLLRNAYWIIYTLNMTGLNELDTPSQIQRQSNIRFHFSTNREWQVQESFPGLPSYRVFPDKSNPDYLQVIDSSFVYLGRERQSSWKYWFLQIR